MVYPADQKETEADQKKSSADHLGYGQVVIDPTGWKREKEGSDSVASCHQSNLPAVESDFQKMEGDEEKDGIDRQFPAEVNEMDPFVIDQ